MLMIFLNTPRKCVVQWVNESAAQRILAQLNTTSQTRAVFSGTKCGNADYYNVYEVRNPQLCGYVLECYAGGAYIVRPKLPSESCAMWRKVVKVKLRHVAQGRKGEAAPCGARS